MILNPCNKCWSDAQVDEHEYKVDHMPSVAVSCSKCGGLRATDWKFSKEDAVYEWQEANPISTAAKLLGEYATLYKGSSADNIEITECRACRAAVRGNKTIQDIEHTSDCTLLPAIPALKVKHG